PAAAGDADLGAGRDVPDPVGPPPVRRDDDQQVGGPLARQQDLARQARPASRGGEQDPAGRALEVATEAPDDGPLHGPNPPRDEVQARGERLTTPGVHRTRLRRTRQVGLQTNATTKPIRHASCTAKKPKRTLKRRPAPGLTWTIDCVIRAPR